MIGVAYQTDLDHVRNLLKQILKADERILQYPSPDAFFKDFGSSAVEIEVIYWVKNIKEYFPLRSDIISNINNTFKVEGIEIPFDRHDVYIKNLPPNPDVNH